MTLLLKPNVSYDNVKLLIAMCIFHICLFALYLVVFCDNVLKFEL